MVAETRKTGRALLARGPDLWACATLVLVALLAAAALWGPGMVNTRGGGDSPFLLQRTHQMVANLRAGVFPVRWMPDGAYGLGYPFFSYYAALPYYLVGLLALTGLDLLTALKVVQTLGFVAAALGMYGWMYRMARSRWAAWLAAVAYAVAPFHLVNVYVRGDSLSEFYAFIFYPLILWALDGIRDSQSIVRNLPSAICNLQFSAAALAFAGLVLTHNLSALIFFPFILLYLVMLAWREKKDHWQVLGIGTLALGLGFLLSAWFWLPALAELGQVQLGPSTQDYFHYSRHFRTFNLVQDRFLFDYSTTAGDTARSPFAMGAVQAGFAVLGGLVLVARCLRRRLEARWAFVLIGLLVSTAMITPLSKPLWDHLPLLPVVQFPWRFLSVQALFAAAATAVLVPPICVPGTRSTTHAPLAIGHWSLVIGHWSFFLALPIAALLALSVLLPLRPERLPIGPADVTVERLRLYELFAGNIGTTIRYEWLPRTVNPRPFTSDALIEPGASPRAIPLDGASLDAVLMEQGPTRQVWRVWGEGGGIAFPLLHWPGWKAQVDGEPARVWPVEGSGYLALAVPPGEHTAILRLGRTPVRAAAEATSLAAAVVLLAFSIKAHVRNPKSQIPNPKLVIGHWSLVIPPLFATVALAVLLLLPRGTFDGETDLTMDFDLMPYLHHNLRGVDFEGGPTLVGYRLSSRELAPGDALTVTMDWAHTTGAYTATVRLVSPAAVRYDVEPLAEAGCNLQSPISDSVVLKLPEDLPRGVYLLQLHVSGLAEESSATASLRPLTPGGERRGTIYLRPVRVPCGPSLSPDASVLAPFGPAIWLHEATVAQLGPDRMAVKLSWSATRPVAANYGISLRLFDGDGQLRVSRDTQPGYGFLPTSLWRPGELVTDEYVLALPEDLPPGDGYHLEVLLYQVATLEPVGHARVGDFALPLETQFEARQPPRTFSLPALRHPLGVDFGGEVRLAGYDLEQGEDALRLTLWWQALRAPQADYTVFVHLFDPATEALAAQSDAQPRGGMAPTSWWAAGEVVSEAVTLSLEGVPQGTYQLAVGLYDQTLTRLQAVGSDEQRLPDDRVILPGIVEAEP
ncbi:MAG TPA: 6-pyruvoyl-tetrahydropterin synthase-related protein [Anaerolineae bacterium]|nr:6-pyruvoyl-tetrahydropterin synthase-related protein [Anaerolineae bacterium]